MQHRYICEALGPLCWVPPSTQRLSKALLWDPCGKRWSGWTLGAHLMTVNEIFAKFGKLSNFIILKNGK